MRELSASDITKEVLLKFRAKGYTIWRNATWTAGKRQHIVTPGISDCLGFSPTGHFTAVEVKKIGDNIKPAQAVFLSMVLYKGGEAYIATQEGSNVVIKPYQP